MKKERQVLIDQLAEMVRLEVMRDETDIENLPVYLCAHQIIVDRYPFGRHEHRPWITWENATFEEHPVIGIDINWPLEQQLFSIAHELGHLMLSWNWQPRQLNPKRKSVRDSDNPKVVSYCAAEQLVYCENESVEEREAHHFALAFLMPTQQVQHLMQANPELQPPHMIKIMSHYFQVDLRLAGRRYHQVKFEPKEPPIGPQIYFMPKR